MKQAPVDQTQNSLVNCLYSPTDQAQHSLVYILRYTVQETRARTPWLHVTLCILRYTEYYITASVLYFVQSYCFHHFLVNILKITITAVPKLRSSIFIKKSLFFFLVLKRSSIAPRFKTQREIESLWEFCFANNMKSTRMVTLKSCARCPE